MNNKAFLQPPLLYQNPMQRLFHLFISAKPLFPNDQNWQGRTLRYPQLSGSLCIPFLTGGRKHIISGNLHIQSLFLLGRYASVVQSIKICVPLTGSAYILIIELHLQRFVGSAAGRKTKQHG
mgnify:CR=1 FL=1